ncbi:serine acetyltransferase [uncultured Methylobacterium sp.]|uniref:serine acetyltransferase n=1 Tax=uncultured Methylobacterium sp. TaxID=157278 RepID=UPI0035C98D9F
MTALGTDSGDRALDHGRVATVRALLTADLDRIVRQTNGGASVSRARRLMHVMLPAMQCAILHRTAHLLQVRGWRRAAARVAGLSVRLTGASIHPGSRVGPGLFVPHPARIAFCGTAGRDLVILPAAIVLPDAPSPAWLPFPADAPRLGDGVVIGAQAVVQGRVALGDHALVGVGVVTRRDVPAGVVTVQVMRQTVVARPPAPAAEAA